MLPNLFVLLQLLQMRKKAPEIITKEIQIHKN